MNGVRTTTRRSTVVFLLAVLTLSSSLILSGESGTGVVLFTLRDQAVVASILLVVSVGFWYAWWRGAGPKSVKSLGGSLLISSGVVAPFIVLQWANRRAFHEDFPFALFLFMSLHSLLIVLLLTPALRRVRAQGSLRALTLGHWAGVLLGVVLAAGFVGVVLDQLPCFVGVPNCD